MLEILWTGLRPELQQLMVYAPRRTIQELRSSARLLESINNTVKREIPSQYAPRRDRHVHAINSNMQELRHTPKPHDDEDSDAPHQPELANPAYVSEAVTTLICWNCRESGHRFSVCRADRKVFCYGCGAPDTYLPDCQRCAKPKNERPSTLPSQRYSKPRH